MTNGQEMTKLLRLTPRFTPLSVAVLALGLTTGGISGNGLGAAPAQAQGGGLFAPVITVNGTGISRYEIEQRMKFLQLLRQSGDLRKSAEDALIEDRLRMWRAKLDGISASAADIDGGMTEFAGRANLSKEQFVAELAKADISEQTFRDFVTAGIAWREVIRARFTGRVHITDADIDRALRVEAERGTGTRVLISEIIIPAPAEYAAEAHQVAEQVSAIHDEKAFAEAARQVSAATTRDQGGRLDWMPLQNLPPALRTTIMALKPGEATAPIDLNGAVAVFMLRAMDEGGSVSMGAQTLGYATLILGASGTPEAAKLGARVASDAKSCDNLYTIARDLPASQLTRVDPVVQGSIPQDIGVALAHLDPGETTRTQRGGNDVLLMLCSRERVYDTAKGQAAPSREAVRAQVLNQRLNRYSDSYLADIMADAVIVRQ
ncbi:MAG TPA: peptidylprolyl isomerase [Paenirhodobacter sp.]